MAASPSLSRSAWQGEVAQPERGTQRMFNAFPSSEPTGAMTLIDAYYEPCEAANGRQALMFEAEEMCFRHRGGWVLLRIIGRVFVPKQHRARAGRRTSRTVQREEFHPIAIAVSQRAIGALEDGVLPVRRAGFSGGPQCPAARGIDPRRGTSCHDLPNCTGALVPRRLYAGVRHQRDGCG